MLLAVQRNNKGVVTNEVEYYMPADIYDKLAKIQKEVTISIRG